MWDDSSELFSRPNYVAHFLQRRLSITLRFPRFPVPRFPPLWFGAGFSSLAFSTPAIWCRAFRSRVFHTCDLVPGFPVPRFPVSRFQRPRVRHQRALSPRLSMMMMMMMLNTDSPGGSIGAVARYVSFAQITCDLLFWFSRPIGLRVVQYHHSTHHPNLMLRMEWCNGHGSWVMGHVSHGSTAWRVTWVMDHKNYPFSSLSEKRCDIKLQSLLNRSLIGICMCAFGWCQNIGWPLTATSHNIARNMPLQYTK